MQFLHRDSKVTASLLVRCVFVCWLPICGQWPLHESLVRRRGAIKTFAIPPIMNQSVTLGAPCDEVVDPQFVTLSFCQPASQLAPPLLAFKKKKWGSTGAFFMSFSSQNNYCPLMRPSGISQPSHPAVSP